MTPKSNTSNTDDGKSKRINVTFDKAIYDIISQTNELGTSDFLNCQSILINLSKY